MSVSTQSLSLIIQQVVPEFSNVLPAVFLWKNMVIDFVWVVNIRSSLVQTHLLIKGNCNNILLYHKLQMTVASSVTVSFQM